MNVGERQRRRAAAFAIDALLVLDSHDPRNVTGRTADEDFGPGFAPTVAQTADGVGVLVLARVRVFFPSQFRIRGRL